MATEIEPRKAPKAAVDLERAFAELCGRIRRVDLVGHLLVLLLIVFGYACVVGVFDLFAGQSPRASVAAARWAGFAAFCVAFGIGLARLVRCWFSSVNPYYVARQIERALPDAKNSLINWLDLQSQDLPAAFAKNLSSRAEERMREADAEQLAPRRTNRVLLGVLAGPALGLLVLLIVNPPAYFVRAFAPFHAPEAGTVLTLVAPANGDAEVGPAQALAFAARIEGRVPTGNRPDAPTLHYRYQPSEDFRALPLQFDGDLWSARMSAGQIRTGVTYKISAGDAETAEHRVRVRAAAHVQRFDVAYQYRAYRGLDDATIAFPNRHFFRPIIHGPPGTDVELTIRGSRPVKHAAVEFSDDAGAREQAMRMVASDPRAFVCKWTLTRSGTFRVRFTTTDGEENADRQWHPIEVQPDDAPRVLLRQPGKDVAVPENGTLELAGMATSDAGLKALTLRLRIISGANEPALAPIPFRGGMPLGFEDGTYPREVEYFEALALDQLKTDKGVIHFPGPGAVIEYWLEAVDCTDAPNAEGNLGKSALYKITLAAKIDPQKQQAQRQAALDRKQQRAKSQDGNRAQQNQKDKNGPGGGGPSQGQKNEIENKLNQALNDQKQQGNQGSAKSASDQQNGEKKDGPKDGNNQAKEKRPPMSPDNAGQPKEQGDNQKGPGESKGDGDQIKAPAKTNAAPGAAKDGPKDSGSSAKDAGPMGQPPPGGAKDGGDLGMNTPMPTQPKNDAAADGAPAPIAKSDPGADSPMHGQAKGIEKNGPDAPNKNVAANATAPNAIAKAGMKNDAAGNAKQEPNDQANGPGKARGDDTKPGKQEPGLSDIAKLNEQLMDQGDNGNQAAEKLKDIAKNAADPKTRDLAAEALKANNRDPNTGEKKKGPNTYGSLGKSKGISDDVKAAAANREFAAKIGQLQLADWQKQLTPELLKKAGISEAEWARYVQAMRVYDAQVRRLNAKLLRDAELSELRGAGGTLAPRVVEGGNVNSALDGGSDLPPPELVEPLRRFRK